VQPLNPEQVIQQVQLRRRPTTSESTSSSLSGDDIRQARRLFKRIVGLHPSADARKLEDLMEKLTVQAHLIKAENEGLRKAVRNRKAAETAW